MPRRAPRSCVSRRGDRRGQVRSFILLLLVSLPSVLLGYAFVCVLFAHYSFGVTRAHRRSCIDAVAITTPASRGACARGTKLGADGAAPTERDRGATWLVAESLRCSVAWHEVGDFSAHGDASANARSHDTTSTATDSSGAAERGIEHIFDTERRTAALLGRRARSGQFGARTAPWRKALLLEGRT